MDIGRMIKRYREDKTMTQAKLAELAEMDSNNISRLERGEAQPTLETVLKLCNALDVTPNDLLMFSYNAEPETLKGEIASLVNNCSSEDLKKIIEYIYFVTKR